MNVYETHDLAALLAGNPYPGRGIVLGKTADGKQSVAAYFIMGRSENSRNRVFVKEPDGPNWTPRISGLLSPDGSYKLSILKSADAEGTACARYTFAYPGLAGVGHFLHTYVTDGNPIPTFQGEPERVAIPDTLEDCVNLLWSNLNEANKISLYVRYTDLATGTWEERIVNKYQ